MERDDPKDDRGYDGTSIWLVSDWSAKNLFDIFRHIALNKDIDLCTSVNKCIDFFFANAYFCLFMNA